MPACPGRSLMFGADINDRPTWVNPMPFEPEARNHSTGWWERNQKETMNLLATSDWSFRLVM